MAKVGKKFDKSIIIRPTTVAAAIEGEVRVDSASDELKAFLDGIERTLVSEDQSQTLENKVIDSDDNSISNLEVDNLKAGVLNTSTSLAGASDTQVPSALAVKTYVDDSIQTIDQADEISYDNSSSGLTATDVQAAIDEVDVDVDDLNTLSGVAKNAQNLGTFTGSTIPDNQTNKQAFQALETAHEEVDVNVNDLITLSGVAENATDLGTFTGSTIPDNSDNKEALQALETSVETKAASSVVTEIDQNVDDLVSLSGVAENATNLGTFTGSTIPDNQTNKQALQALETAVETKQVAGNYITDLTGDVTATGPGSVAGTISANAVTNTKLADMAANTIKGNNTGSPADPIDLTVTQTTAMLNNFVGDSGAGGTKGLVPAPASGDTAANKFLKADGVWSTVSGATATPDTSYGIHNLGISASVAANALTVAIKTSSGTDASVGSPVSVAFGSATITTGQFSILNLTSALSLVITTGSTLGQIDATASDIYVYLINNAGTIKIGVSRLKLPENQLWTTVAEGGAGAADSSLELYSDAVYTNVRIRCVGMVTNTQSNAGTWATAPSAITLNPLPNQTIGCSYSTNAGQSIANNSNVTLAYEDRIFDSLNLWVSNTFTAPLTGWYNFKGLVELAATSTFSGSELCYGFISGTTTFFLESQFPNSTNVEKVFPISGSIYMVRKTTATLRFYQNSGGSLSRTTTDSTNMMSITYAGDF